MEIANQNWSNKNFSTINFLFCFIFPTKSLRKASFEIKLHKQKLVSIIKRFFWYTIIEQHIIFTQQLVILLKCDSQLDYEQCWWMRWNATTISTFNQYGGTKSDQNTKQFLLRVAALVFYNVSIDTITLLICKTTFYLWVFILIFVANP